MVSITQDQFELPGPNRSHRCYMTPPARNSVTAAKSCCCFAVEAARVLVAHLILASAYIHANGLSMEVSLLVEQVTR